MYLLLQQQQQQQQKQLVMFKLFILIILLLLLLLSVVVSAAVQSSNTNIIVHDDTKTKSITTSSRKLQQNNNDSDNDEIISLWFSIWFPNKENNYNQNVETILVNALEICLCNEKSSDIILVEPMAIDFNTELYNQYNRCIKYDKDIVNSGDKNIDSAATVIRATPIAMDIQERSYNNDLSWSVYTISYQLIQIGDVFIQETIMNNPNLDINDIYTEASNAVKQVLQLSLNLHITEKQFDTYITEQSNGNMIAFTSPVREEIETFTAIMDGTDSEDNTVLNTNGSSNNNNEFIPRIWYPMRIAGIGLFGTTVLLYVLLIQLAKRRRYRIDNKLNNNNMNINDDNNNNDNNSFTHEGVDEILQQSKPFLILQPTYKNDVVSNIANDILLSSSQQQELEHNNDNNNKKETSSFDYDDIDDDNGLDDLLNVSKK